MDSRISETVTGFEFEVGKRVLLERDRFLLRRNPDLQSERQKLDEVVRCTLKCEEPVLTIPLTIFVDLEIKEASGDSLAPSYLFRYLGIYMK